MPDETTPKAEQGTEAREPRAGRKLIQWQRPMKVVLYATIPPTLAAIYYFGWRVLAMIVVSAAAAFLAEYVFVRREGKPVTSAAFVTSTLLALTLPPTLPLWWVALGAIVAISFGKMMLGGFGRNTFNPALTGRCFLYICFPTFMTSSFVIPQSGGALGRWLTSYDALTAATPLGQWRDLTQAYDYNAADLFLGKVGGSAGETCAIAILIGAAILLITKVANWRLMVAMALGALATSLIGGAFGAERIPGPEFTFGAGGLLFAAVFMITDPVSASSTQTGRWISGLMAGSLTVVLRSYSIFAGGVMFAILLANTFSPLIDSLVRMAGERTKAKEGAS